jgi:hypothetical protein
METQALQVGKRLHHANSMRHEIIWLQSKRAFFCCAATVNNVDFALVAEQIASRIIHLVAGGKGPASTPCDLQGGR